MAVFRLPATRFRGHRLRGYRLSFPRKRESIGFGNGVSREGTDVPPSQGTKLGRGANFRCLMSDAPIPGDYIEAEGRAGRMGARLMAIVAEGNRERVYLTPTSEHEERAREAAPEWRPKQSLPDDHRNFWTFSYGLTTYGDLFTPRQLVALTTFSNLVAEAIARVKQDTLGARASRPLKENAGGAPALPGRTVPRSASEMCAWRKSPQRTCLQVKLGLPSVPPPS